MSGFQYGRKEMRSKPLKISGNDIKKKFLSFSASETMCFLRVLPLLIGDLIPENESHWQLILKLRHLVEVIYSPVFHQKTFIYLKNIISEYLRLLNELFPNENSSKPKHHNLVHYPEVLQLMGPLS